jgi:hypothetical protein
MSSGQRAQRLYGTQSDLDVDHFRLRVVQDVLNEASALYWKRRADALERALPRHGDFHGQATPDDLEERRRALRDEILACRRHANLLASGKLASPVADEQIIDVLQQEVARQVEELAVRQSRPDELAVRREMKRQDETC